MNLSIPAGFCVALSLVAASACSSDKVEEPQPGPGAAGANTGQSGAPASAGNNPTPGASGSTPNGQAGGSSTSGSGGTDAAGTAGVGTSGGGAGGVQGGAPTTGGSAGVAGFEAGDTVPPRKLNFMAAAKESIHGQAGVDGRAKPLGKLVVDIGVNSGGYVSWLAKRGYHSMGAPCGSCPAPNLDAGRDEVGKCRMGEFANTEAKVKSTLIDLAGKFPEEDWGYFLNADMSVRWSDVAITGMSHGATTAAVAGRIGQRMWRVVSRSGPRDTTCGAAGGVCKLPLTTPSYDTACKPEKIASWLDQPSKTPLNRFYGLVGITDVECGDIAFDMQYAKYPGVPLLWDAAGAVLTGSNQFFSTTGGHLDFLNAADKPPRTEEVLNIAFGIPPENQNPAF